MLYVSVGSLNHTFDTILYCMLTTYNLNKNIKKLRTIVPEAMKRKCE